MLWIEITEMHGYIY